MAASASSSAGSSGLPTLARSIAGALRRRCERTKLVEDDLGAKPWSLKFRDSRAEAGFASGLSARLSTAIVPVGSMVFITCSIWAARTDLQRIQAADESDNREDHVVVAIAGMNAVIGLVGLAMSLMGLAQLKWGRLSSLQLECAFLSFTAFVLILCPFTERLYINHLLGYGDYSDVCEIWTFLAIDAIVTLTSLLPIRWSSLRVFMVFAAVWYPLLNLALFGDIDRVPELIVLELLIGFAVIGKRATETQERRLFHTVTLERSRRAHTEFLLEQQQQQPPLPIRAPSAATTLATEVIFDERAAKARLEAALEKVEEIAKKEQWLIRPEEILIETTSLLGRGGCGAILAGSMGGLPVAVKMPLDRAYAEGVRRTTTLLTELRVLRKVRHPNIAMFYGAVVDLQAHEMAVVLELVHGSDLCSFVQERCKPTVPLRDEVAYSLICGMARAVWYLHRHEPTIVHADLKANNILVENSDSRTPCAKLVDFGLSRILAGKVPSMGGTLNWRAPETLKRGSKPAPAADVYGFGQVLMYILTAEEPFVGWSDSNIRGALLARDVPLIELPEFATETFTRLHATGAMCIFGEADKRPVMQEVCRSLRTIVTDKSRPMRRLGELRSEIWWGHMDGPWDSSSETSSMLRPARWEDAIPQLRAVLKGDHPEPVPAPDPPQPLSPTLSPVISGPDEAPRSESDVERRADARPPDAPRFDRDEQQRAACVSL